jgi:hypothetical protein
LNSPDFIFYFSSILILSINTNGRLTRHILCQPVRSHCGRQLGVVPLNHRGTVAHLLAECVDVHLVPESVKETSKNATFPIEINSLACI